MAMSESAKDKQGAATTEQWVREASQRLEQAQWVIAIIRAMSEETRPSTLVGADLVAVDGEWGVCTAASSRASSIAPTPIATTQQTGESACPSDSLDQERHGTRIDAVSNTERENPPLFPTLVETAPVPKRLPAWARLAEAFALDWANEHARSLALEAHKVFEAPARVPGLQTPWSSGLPEAAKPSGLLLATLITATQRAADRQNPLALELLPGLQVLESLELSRAASCVPAAAPKRTRPR